MSQDTPYWDSPNYADDPCDDITVTEDWQAWLHTIESLTGTCADRS